ncbi:hypothetical protein ACHAXR_011827 [Thalassiosira sp. AJA248-18]
MMLSRTRANAATARGRASRAPLSSVNANLVRKDTPRTPHELNKTSKRKTDSGKIVSTKKKQSKTRRKNEIYTPLVINSSAQNKRSNGSSKSMPKQPPGHSNLPINESNSTDQSNSAGGRIGQSEANLTTAPSIKTTSIDCHDASIPVVHLGSVEQPLILNFGYKSNVVGKMRSLPVRIVAPSSPTSPDAEFPIEFEHIPFGSGFEVIFGGLDAVKHEYVACNVKSVVEMNAPTVLHVLWTPTKEGEVREEIHMKTAWGSLQIPMLGIARNASHMSKPARSIGQPKDLTSFYGRDNITYDAQQWEEKQCATFTNWLNNLFHPENGVNPMNEEQLSKEFQAARELFDSPKMQAIRFSVEKEVKEGRLAMSPSSSRNILDEVHVQEQLTKLLLSYTPRWLQLGLGIVLSMNDDGTFKMTNEMTKDSLKKIIKQRVLSEPHAIRKYTGGRCKTPSGKFESKMRVTVHQHALSQIMILVFFLDKAKANRVLAQDPCLFEKSSCMKSSEEMLISLFQDCFSKQGSIIKHLDYEGISVFHVQNPLDEYDFYVKNLAVDLKDGVCLAKMIDIVTDRSNLLSSMRLPTTTRQYKICNVNLALSALRRLGTPNISDVTTAHIVNAHQPRIQQLLWSTILHFELPEFREDIIHYKASRLIQAQARRFLAMRSYRLAHHGTVLFQSLYHGFIVRVTIMRMSSAATFIQQVWRGYNAKLLYRHDLMDIITSQSMCRRFIARNQVEKMSKSMNNASIEIQRTWRGYRAKIDYGCNLMDIITVQSICRCFIARNQAARMSQALGRASVIIQRMWRGYSAQLSYGFDLMDIITIQSIGRRFIARKAARHHACTRKIQSTVRMWVAKRLYDNARRGICAIQVRIRKVLASAQARNIKSHIVHLQRVCRGWLSRKQFIVISTKRMQEAEVILATPRPCNIEQDNEEANGEIMPEITDSDEMGSETNRNGAKTASIDSNTPGIQSSSWPYYGPSQIDETDTTPSQMNVAATNDIKTVSIGSNALPRFHNPRDNSYSTSEVSVLQDDEEISFNTYHACRERDQGQIGYIAGEAKNTVSHPVVTHVQPSPRQHYNYLKCEEHASNRRDFSLVGKVERVGSDATDSIDTKRFSSSNDKPGAQLSPMTNSLSLGSSSTLDSSVLQDDGEEMFFTTKHAPTRRGFRPVDKIAKLTNESEEVANDSRIINDTNDVSSDNDKPRTLSSKIFLSEKEVDSPSPEQEMATILIQKVWRQYNLSKSFVTKKEAIIMCQNRWRRCVAQREVQLIREVAATKISSAYRSHATRDNFVLALDYRGHSAGKIAAGLECLNDLQRERCATLVQTCFRRHACQSQYATQISGLISLQAQSRNWLTRETANRREKAATDIQKICRGFAAYDQFIVTKFAVIILQCAVRRYVIAVKYRFLRKSVVITQAIFRGRKARREIAIQHNHIRVLQRAGRRLLAKVERRQKILLAAASLQQTQSSAAVHLQRMWRGYMANVDYILLILATIKIQSLARSHMAATKYRHCLRGVVSVQAHIRRRKARDHIDIWQANSVILQTAGRRFLARLEMRRISGAVATLQRAARAMITCLHNEVECFAATEIQRTWRGYNANVDFMLVAVSAIKTQAVVRGKQARQGIASQRKSVRNLQRVGRGFLARLERRRLVAAVSTLQRAARTMIACIDIERECFAAIDVQRAWRCYRSNVDYMLMVVSAITIQSFTRQIMAKIRAEKLVKERLAAAAEKVRIERARAFAGHRQREEESLRLNGNEHQSNQRAYDAGKGVAVKQGKDLRFTFSTSAKFDETTQVSSKPRHDESTGLEIRTPNEVYGATRSSSDPCPDAGMTRPSFSDYGPRASNSWQTELPCLLASEVDSLPNTPLLIPYPQADTKQSSKFERHTANAIRIVHKSRKFSEVLKALMSLEKITKQSIEACKMIVESNAQDKMFSIIRSCNRSSPHLELIRVILSILTNLIQHPSILSRLATDEAIDAMTDLVQLFRDKSNIFTLSSHLLEQMLFSCSRLMRKYSTPENKKRLRGVVLLCKKKVSSLEDMHKGICSLENVIRIVKVNCA